jgi:hypothetical protein
MVPIIVQGRTPLRSIGALPKATPVTVPISVPLVVQVRVPKGEGTVSFKPVERTVPFVVLPIRSMVSEPNASTVGGPFVQLLNPIEVTGPPTVAPVRVDVANFSDDTVHVLAPVPNVSSNTTGLRRLPSTVTLDDCATPPTSNVVAVAQLVVIANAKAAARMAEARLFAFIVPPGLPESVPRGWMPPVSRRPHV